jgi:hypothetical protein
MRENLLTKSAPLQNLKIKNNPDGKTPRGANQSDLP